jgi:PAS domain S-box-containing protein
MAWRVRPDMSCEHVSASWLAFTGMEAEQALGDGWTRGVHPEDLACWLDTCVRAFDAREPFEIEYRLRRRDGEYRWVLDRGAPRTSRDGVFLGYAGACMDIDARKRAEQDLARALERERRLRIATEETSRLKDGFLATVLRDLRSPVQAIAAWASHLRAQVPAASEAARALDAIERSARAQNRIIGSLLDVSGASAGAAEAPLLSGARVLLVDDDPGAREGTARLLGIAGAEVKSAASAAEALDTLRAWHPDALLSALAMRSNDGCALIRAVRALPAERGGCLRAAAIIGHAEEGPRALAAGYDAQLAKPVEPVALLATVARLAQGA